MNRQIVTVEEVAADPTNAYQITVSHSVSTVKVLARGRRFNTRMGVAAPENLLAGTHTSGLPKEKK